VLYDTEDNFKENQTLTYGVLQSMTACSYSEIMHVLVYIAKMCFHLLDFNVLNYSI